MKTVKNDAEVRKAAKKWIRDIYPRECSKEALKVQAFNKAYQIDLYLDNHHDGKKTVEMMHLYTDALYKDGVAEAAINMIRHLLPYQVEEFRKSDGEQVSLLNKTLAFIKKLILMNHPAGVYFHVVCVLNGLIKGSGLGEDAVDEGLLYMTMLASEGNPYALRFDKNWIKYEEAKYGKE